MKTKLLKRLRKEAEAKIPIIQTQMRDMGVGEDRFEVFYMLRSKTNNRIDAERIARMHRRTYILRQVRELKQRRK